MSLPTLAARTTSRPVTTTVPAVTVSPSATSAGTDSPVIMLVSTADWPNSTSPSAAIRSPGPDHEPLARPPAAATGTRRSVPSASSTQASLRARRGQLAHRVPGVAPGPGLIQPAGQQERGHRRGDLQVDPAAGGVQQQLPRAHPGLAAVQHEHRVHRPAARRGDAQRHQRVHRRPTPCRAFFSAAWWNGHAAQTTTGAASTTSTHCQPGNRDDGNSDSSTDRSLSGTKNTSATISRRRR